MIDLLLLFLFLALEALLIPLVITANSSVEILELTEPVWTEALQEILWCPYLRCPYRTHVCAHYAFSYVFVVRIIFWYM